MKKRFWRKLLAACITITLLYTVIAGLVFAFQNNQIIQTELLNQRRAFMDQARTRMDMKLNAAFNYAAQLRVRKDILSYAREQEKDYFVITNVFNELKANMNAFTNFGYQIDVVKQGGDLIITPYSTMSREQYYRFMNFDSGTTAWLEAFEETRALPSTAMVQTKQATGSRSPVTENGEPDTRGPLVTFVQHEPLPNGEGIMIVISFYQDQFYPVSGSDQESFKLLYDKEWMGAGDAAGENVHQAEAVLAELEENARYAEFELDGRQVFTAKSDSLGKLYYVYSLPGHTWGQGLTGVLKKLLQFYAVMMALGVAVSLVAANKLYKPVRGAVSSFSKDGEPMVMDEFAFIREYAGRIHTANDQLQEMLQHNRLPLKKKFMRDLILGLMPGGQAEAGIRRHELEWLEGPSVVVVLEFLEDKLWGEAYTLETMLEIKAQAVLIVMEHLNVYGPNDSVELDHLHYAILLKYSGTQALRKLVLSAVAGVEERFGIRITAAAGRPVESGAALKESCETAVKLLEERQVQDQHPVITFEEMGHKSGMGCYYPLDAERDLTVSVLQGRPEEAAELFDRIWEENEGRAQNREETLQLFLYAMMTTLSRILHHLNKPVTEIIPGGLPVVYPAADPGRRTGELRGQLRELLLRVAVYVRDRSKEQDHSVASQMVAYVHERYRLDISLTDMAESFNLSPNYISQLIKEKTGESFKDYLSAYRVKQAKRIMNEQGELKIHDVAALAGWSNVNTFIRVFKKYEGVTPGQYKQEMERVEG